jgi:hypothetical protein
MDWNTAVPPAVGAATGSLITGLFVVFGAYRKTRLEIKATIEEQLKNFRSRSKSTAREPSSKK